MKKLALLIALIFSTPVYAGVSCSVPFNLQNNTIADATQVMANYNALITCLANAAKAGANNDITSLTALSTPLTLLQGGTPMYGGGTSSGTNTQVVSVVSPPSYALALSRSVVFIVGSGNTGPTTLNVTGTGNVNFFRRTQLGISAMVGGELIAGHEATAYFDGTQYQLVSSGPVLVGELRDYSGSTAPAGWLFADGSCQLRSQYADLFAVIGTTYDPTGSTCDVAHFALPDFRGRVSVAKDDQGGVAANRITNAGSGCTGTTLGGAGCGNQIVTLLQSDLPNVNQTVAITDPGHFHSVANTGTSQTTTPGGQGSVAFTGSQNTGTSTTGITASVRINGNVTQTNVNKLPPLQIVTKIIKP